MDAVIEHLQTNYVAYIVLAICTLPLIYLTRKYSVPVILYTLEILVYCTIVHAVVHVVVLLTVWFKDQSSFRALDSKGVEEISWTTPLLEPWARELYDPAGLFIFEIIVFVLIFAAVIRYRPMKIHKGRQRKFDDRGKKIKSGARSAAGAKPPAYGSYKK